MPGASRGEQSELQTGHTAKRKRSAAQDFSPSPSLVGLTSTPARRQTQTHDPNVVAVSKRFAKTAQLMLNEIASHRLASIFAKPLSEREAPGYRQLIHRPQDLKSIKAAVSKGSRAAIAAMDEIEDRPENSETPTPTKPGFVPLGRQLVKKNEDLIPPKGIVNSSQLEKELMRMFANAIMFNPLPSTERGLGAHLRLDRHDSHPDRSSPSSASDSSQTDVGIIQDAREMFDDVVKSISDFRDLEEERMEGMAQPWGGPNSALRAPSVSVSSAMGDDGLGGVEDAEGDNPGTSRKRRRIGEG